VQKCFNKLQITESCLGKSGYADKTQAFPFLAQSAFTKFTEAIDVKH